MHAFVTCYSCMHAIGLLGIQFFLSALRYLANNKASSLIKVSTICMDAAGSNFVFPSSPIIDKRSPTRGMSYELKFKSMGNASLGKATLYPHFSYCCSKRRVNNQFIAAVVFTFRLLWIHYSHLSPHSTTYSTHKLCLNYLVLCNHRIVFCAVSDLLNGLLCIYEFLNWL
jgi:hypothetical protein